MRPELHISSVIAQAPFCTVCKSLILQAPTSESGFLHQAHASNLRIEHESPSGCPLCSLFWRKLKEEAPAGGRSAYGEYIAPFDESHPVRIHIPMIGEDRCHLGDIHVFSGPSAILDRLRLFKNAQYKYHRATFTCTKGETYPSLSEYVAAQVVRMSTDFAGPLRKVSRYSKVLDQHDSSESFQLVSKWLSECVDHHSTCTSHLDEFWPTRVLDVGPPDGSVVPFLDTSGIRATPQQEYIALSYCWGKQHWTGNATAETTPQNINKRKSGIPIEELPKTIQDAVIITRRLGVRYLWVDSLCIMQGDSQAAVSDWERESLQMAKVYGCAYLTISAAWAQSVHQGIFTKMSEEWQSIRYPIKATAVSESDSTLKGNLYFGPGDFSVEFNALEDQPLHRRAWTLQERILSRRGLICNRDQFAWECGEANLTESGTKMTFGVGAMSLTGIDANVDLELWHSIVTDYSRRSLSYASDKFPALAGLALGFQQHSSSPTGNYLAGLWQETLLEDLQWMHTDYKGCRASTYLAPSWSWAAVDGEVAWPETHLRNCHPYPTELLSSRIENIAENPFGKVIFGWITLRGPLRRVDQLLVSQPSRRYEYSRYGSSKVYYTDYDGVCKFSNCLVFLDMRDSEGTTELEARIVQTGHSVPVDYSRERSCYSRTCDGPFEIWALEITRGAFLLLTPESVLKEGMSEIVFTRLGSGECYDSWLTNGRIETCTIV